MAKKKAKKKKTKKKVKSHTITPSSVRHISGSGWIL